MTLTVTIGCDRARRDARQLADLPIRSGGDLQWRVSGVRPGGASAVTSTAHAGDPAREPWLRSSAARDRVGVGGTAQRASRREVNAPSTPLLPVIPPASSSRNRFRRTGGGA